MMKYKAELDKIPMAVYIELQEGDFDGEFEDMDSQDAARKLQQEYISIIAGRKVTYEVTRSDSETNIQLQMVCLEAARFMASTGRTENAVTIMDAIGYDVKGKSAEQILAKIDNATNMARLRLDRMKQSRKEPEKQSGQENDRHLKERCAMMEYYKMHIDIKEITAAEYAQLLKRMCDDLERDARRMNAARK